MRQFDVYAVELSGLHLVEASAGTGKTYAITTLYLRAVVELGLLPEQILVVTFTRAATGELRERIRARLRLAQACLEDPTTEGGAEVLAYLTAQGDPGRCRQRLQRALLVIDQAAVMTIHGFCAAVLEQNAFESRMPFGTELIETVLPLLDEVVNDFMITRVAVLEEPLLLAMRSIGVDAAGLRQLGMAILSRDGCELEPQLGGAQPDFASVLSEFELHRSRARQWLESDSHLRALAGLNKSKPAGTLGKRLAGYVEKVKTWLDEPFHQLKTECETFERLKQLAEQYPAAKTAELLEWFSALAACSTAYAHLRRSILLVGVQLRRTFVEYAWHEVEARKAARSVQSYDDLLRRLRDALTGGAVSRLAESLARRYPLALIDEFQDTDPVQFEVFSRIYRDRASLFLIGDPKQSIYAFRGADIDNYRAAKQDQRVRCHTLATNWRSDSRLVEGVQRLYGTHVDPFLGARIEYVNVAPRTTAKDQWDANDQCLSGVRILWLESEQLGSGSASPGNASPGNATSGKEIAKYRARQQSMSATVKHVEQLLQTRPKGWGRSVRASEIAVLGRTNRECQAMANALRLRGIRCVQTGDASVLDSDAASATLTLLRALLCPTDARCVTAWLIDPLGGLAPAEVERQRADTDAWERWSERLFEWRHIWERSGLLAAVVRLCDDLEVKQRVLRRASGERFMTDLLHVAELTQSAAKHQHLTPQGQLEWLASARSGDGDCSNEDQQLRIEADSEAVLLTTVHRSKGLEFPFVVCPFLWDGGARARPPFLTYRRRSASDPQGKDVVHLEPRLLAGDAPEYRLVESERLRENARLLYVALTRARHQVAVVWVKAAGFEQSALSHLLFGARRDDADAESDEPSSESISHELQTTRKRLAMLCDGASLVLDDEMAEHAALDVALEARVSPLVEPPAPSRVVTATVHTTSYSALTAVSTVHAELGRDVDALPDAREPEQVDAGYSDKRPLGLELPLVELPTGPRTGEALHAILERAEFQRFEHFGEELDVAGILGRFGLHGSDVEAKVRRGIAAVLNVALLPGQSDLRLANVAQSQKKSEFEFLMRVKDLDVARLVSGLGPEVTGVDADYGTDLGRLRFEPVTGFLRGFIDLVFEHAGRFYVVDYKSNALGSTPECFALGRLKLEMRRHHYPVQAAIYAAAVDRWLRTARRDYEYERHFGGVFYLFLRGMLPELGTDCGVFFHRPTARALGAFETMLSEDVS